MKFSAILLSFILVVLSPVNATQNTIMKTDKVHVKKWNNFVSELYQLHVNKTDKVNKKF